MSSQIKQLLQPHFNAIRDHINADPDFKASAATARCTFSITSSDEPNLSVIVSIDHRCAPLSIGPSHASNFGLQARSEDWTAFFAEKLVRPYQSFWGILRVLGPQHKHIKILGDQNAFGRNARLWRIVLDRARDAVHGKAIICALEEPPENEVLDEDSVVGRYMWTNTRAFGKVKIFLESAGSGPQHLLFLHTAGSDSRQHHSLMNNKQLQEKCSMYTFDLPAHGRSSLGSSQSPEGYELGEDSYLEIIDLVIKKARLRNVILCGASMAGHVCLAAAIKAQKLGIHGVIPCEACEHLPFSQPIYEIGGADASLLDPERVCGMCAPMSPEYYKRQIWWQYSSQGIGIFPGDLKFYFRGWDGRGRIDKINTKFCPVYMLTGEFDYSCTTEASKATAQRISGAVFEAMEGLGHFPLVEHPQAMLPHLMRAITHIQASRCAD